MRNPGSDGDLALVAGTKITQREFEQELHQKKERLQNRSSEPIDERLFQTEEFKRGVLDEVVERRLLTIQAAKARVTIGDRELQDAIAKIPAFQRDGRFDPVRYDELLRSQGLTQAGFETSLRRDLSIQQFFGAIDGGALASKAGVELLIQAHSEVREVRSLAISPNEFSDAIPVGETEINEFYVQNSTRFQKPARVRAEFVVLDPKLIESKINVTDADIQKWYSEHKKLYTTDEYRKAGHILIQVGKDANVDEVERARQLAEEISKAVRTDPLKFDEIAKEKSQDPGSSSNGGDLGYFNRGTMVKSFEDAVFSLRKIGEISEPKRSDFGFHIIKLTGIQEAKIRPISEVRGQIASEIRKQGFARKYGEVAETFANYVYEQPDSLMEAAKRFELNIETTDWIEAGSNRIGNYTSNNLVNALFTPNAIEARNNTEVIDIGDGALVAARVIDHQEPYRAPLEAVRREISAEIRHEKAARLVSDKGGKILAGLNSGRAPGEYGLSNPFGVRRNNSAQIDLEAIEKIYEAKINSLPFNIGYQDKNGVYRILRIEKVLFDQPAVDSNIEKQIRKESTALFGAVAVKGLLRDLRQRYEIKYNSAWAVRN